MVKVWKLFLQDQEQDRGAHSIQHSTGALTGAESYEKDIRIGKEVKLSVCSSHDLIHRKLNNDKKTIRTY